ncbi:hypothetical protein Hanom_Chr09g00843231 [Helianthus anomalus]
MRLPFSKTASKRFEHGFQLFTRFILAPTIRPRYLNGSTPGLHPKSLAMVPISSAPTPTPKRLDLKTLILRPEHRKKHRRILIMFPNSSLDQSPITMASSA